MGRLGILADAIVARLFGAPATPPEKLRIRLTDCPTPPMKILLVYPPDRTLPTIPFSSLAVLQGCLRAKGHTTVVRDMNVEVFHQLVRRDTLAYYADMVQRWFEELDAKPSLTPEDRKSAV